MKMNWRRCLIEYKKINRDKLVDWIILITASLAVAVGILLILDQNILDETVGQYNWRRDHSLINGNLFCTVSLYDSEKQEWVSKQDVGTESYTEKEKGQASDSFKRACFNWGIGRELYTAPFIWIPSDKCAIKELNNKLVCYDKFYVEDIVIENKVIVALSIKNSSTNKRVFIMDNRKSDK